MFPTTVNVIRRLQPKAFIIENVKGLTRSAFSNYFQYILLQMTFPEVIQRASEDWLEHLARLEKVETSGGKRGLTYDVVYRVLNAADYGVSQKRERVFLSVSGMIWMPNGPFPMPLMTWTPYWRING